MTRCGVIAVPSRILPLDPAIKLEAAFFFSFLNDVKDRVAREMASTSLSDVDLLDRYSEIGQDSYDVFISYSYADEVIYPLDAFLNLRDAGISAYLPRRFDRSKEKPPKLLDISRTRDALLKSRALVMINGPQASRSQWIPWEIGYMSGKTGKVAISSIADDKNRIRKREFLRLYPSVGFDGADLLVGFPGENSEKMRSWISSS